MPDLTPVVFQTVPVLFGKLPARGDFVRTGPAGPALDAFDDWVQRGLARSRPPAGVAPLLRLVFPSPDASEALVGVVQMSQDRVGRRYPLVVGRSVPLAGADAAKLPDWPVRWAALFDAAAHLVRHATADRMSLGELYAGVERLPDLDHPAGAEAVACDAGAREAPATAFWRAIWGAAADGRVETLLGALAAVLGGEPPGYGLRFPLPTGPEGAVPTPGQRAAAVAAWLRLAGRLGRRHPWRTLLWTDPQGPLPPRARAPVVPVPSPGPAVPPPRPLWTGPSLVLFEQRPSALAFGPALSGVGHRGAVLDLDGGWRDHPDLTPERAAAAVDPALSFDDVLRRL